MTASNDAGSADQTSAPRELHPPPGGMQPTARRRQPVSRRSNRSNGGAGTATTATITTLRETQLDLRGRVGLHAVERPARAEATGGGTVFSFGLDQRAAVRIAIEMRVNGRQSSQLPRPRPQAAPPTGLRIRTSTLARLTRGAYPGSNRVSFTGRIHGRALRPADTRRGFTAIDSAGVSRPQTLTFTMIR